jgi:hypothetical protein
LQARWKGYETDDLVVEVENPVSNDRAVLLCQMKHVIAIRTSDVTFAEVIGAAWRDFAKGTFVRGRDAIALITGPLSSTDLDFRTILEWARTSAGSKEFFEKVQLAHFSSAKKRAKLKAVRDQITNTVGTQSDEDTWWFLKSLHHLQFDLDVLVGSNLALVDGLILQFQSDSHGVWGVLIDQVQQMNQNAGTITRDTIGSEIVSYFERVVAASSFDDFKAATAAPTPSAVATSYPRELAIAFLIGRWSEKAQGDKEFVAQVSGESYDSFVAKLQLELVRAGTPLRYSNHVWWVERRSADFREHAPLIFDTQIERAVSGAIDVLGSAERSEADVGADN